MREKPVEIVVTDTMQQDYRYLLTAREGRDFAPGFTPDLSPRQMLELGVFGGKYMNDCRRSFRQPGFVAPDYHLLPMHRSITSRFRLPSRCVIGSIKAGFASRIRAAGFSGIADITWGADRRTMRARFTMASHAQAHRPNSPSIAAPAMFRAGLCNVRHCYTGHTTAANFSAEGCAIKARRALVRPVDVFVFQRGLVGEAFVYPDRQFRSGRPQRVGLFGIVVVQYCVEPGDYFGMRLRQILPLERVLQKVVEGVILGLSLRCSFQPRAITAW